jgi:hypothetical protein
MTKPKVPNKEVAGSARFRSWRIAAIKEKEHDLLWYQSNKFLREQHESGIGDNIKDIPSALLHFHVRMLQIE